MLLRIKATNRKAKGAVGGIIGIFYYAGFLIPAGESVQMYSSSTSCNMQGCRCVGRLHWMFWSWRGLSATGVRSRGMFFDAGYTCCNLTLILRKTAPIT